MSPASPLADPKWLTIARSYLGVAEVPGPKHNPTIVRWLERLKAPFRDDETPWCGSFVGAVLDEAGQMPMANPWGARNWLRYGKALDRPAYGGLVVFWRGDPKGWSGHVGFVVGRDSRNNLMVLGGNQGNRVSIAPFSNARVLGYRWPNIAPRPERFVLPLLDSDGRVSTDEA